MMVDGGKIFILENGNRMHIRLIVSSYCTYNYEIFDLMQRVFLYDEDVEIFEDSSSRLQSIFVAAGTGEIAVYLRELFRLDITLWV